MKKTLVDKLNPFIISISSLLIFSNCTNSKITFDTDRNGLKLINYHVGGFSDDIFQCYISPYMGKSGDTVNSILKNNRLRNIPDGVREYIYANLNGFNYNINNVEIVLIPYGCKKINNE